MKNVLSQDEIDSLINALASGEIEDVSDVEQEAETQKAKIYDFRRPNKLAKDQMQTIKGIYENYARILSNFLSNQVRNNVKLTIASAEQVTFGEFIRSIPNPTVLGVISMEPLDVPCTIELNPSFCLYLIDLLCGGAMINTIKAREFTDIEMAMIEDILKTMVSNLKGVWSDIVDIHPVLEGMETNPLLHQTMTYSEAVVLLSFKVQVVEENSFINMCVSYRTFEKIAEQLHAKNYDMLRTKKFSNLYTDDIEKVIDQVKLDLKVLLGKATITIDDFLNLSPGDVIQLDSPINRPLDLYVEDKNKLCVQPGLLGEKISVQVIGQKGKDGKRNE